MQSRIMNDKKFGKVIGSKCDLILFTVERSGSFNIITLDL